jgi:hypothetical protein
VVSILTLITASVLIILFNAIRFVHQEENKIFSSLGVSLILFLLRL